MVSIHITLLLISLDHSSKTVDHKRPLVVIVKHKIMFFTLPSIIYQICCNFNYHLCEYLTEKRMLTDNDNFSAKESERFKR